jgi:hypothetical protein
MTYTLNFGDGTTGALSKSNCVGTGAGQGGLQCSASASHAYSNAGTYTAALLDSSGDTLGALTVTVGGKVVRPFVGSTVPPPPASPLDTSSTPTPERLSPDQH